MPTLANITILDRASTPVSHVFKPRDLVDGQGFLFEDRADGSRIGENQLSAFSKKQTSGRLKAQTKISIHKTVTETVNGVAVIKVVGTSYLTVIGDYDPNFTPAECDAVLGMGMKVCDTAANQPTLNKIMTGQERLYG